MLVIDITRFAIRRIFGSSIAAPAFYDVIVGESDSNSDDSVTVIIPTRDKAELLRACIESIEQTTSNVNYKILIVNNDSTQPETMNLFEELARKGHVIQNYPGPFNYSAMMNFAISKIDTPFICLLNNDTMVQNPDWLKGMLSHAKREGVGIVGSLLTYPNGTVQHAGLAVGRRGIASSPRFRRPPSHFGEPLCHKVSAVTFACALLSMQTYRRIGPLDEVLRVGLNDVDYCLRANAIQLTNVVCYDSDLIHLESASRKSVFSPLGFARAIQEIVYFLSKHPRIWGSERYFPL